MATSIEKSQDGSRTSVSSDLGEQEAQLANILCKKHNLIGSSRLAVMLTMMVGLSLFYAMRVDMSVAILCMVNHTAVGEIESAKVNVSQALVQSQEAASVKCAQQNATTSQRSEDGPFIWDSMVQNQILGAFFFGYLLSQVPGGWLSGALGGRWLIFPAMLAQGIFTVLVVPVASSWVAVAVFRVLQGMASGIVPPAVNSVIGQWAPPSERARLSSLAFSGLQLGNVYAFPVSGLLCRYFAWQTVFFFWGTLTFIWLAFWFFFGYNKPSEHPRINEEEKRYLIRELASSVGGQGSVKSQLNLCKFPWFQFLKSPPVWSMIVANFASDWGAYTFLSQTPRYMKSVHGFDIASNSAMSAVPYIGYWAIVVLSGQLADTVQGRKLLTLVWTRRVFAIAGFMVPTLLLLILGYLSCEYWLFALIVLTLIVSTSGLQYGSWLVSVFDFAPKYAGILFGISNTVACVSGIGTNAIAGLFMSANPTLPEWRMLFFTTAFVMAVGCLLYCLLVRAEVQPWATDSEQAKSGRKDDQLETEPLREINKRAEPEA